MQQLSQSMATLNSQETWAPYDTAKDCSQGFCSIYCPQWCYIIFPPPPPIGFEEDDTVGDASAGTVFSPLVIAIIGILASAFLLVSYYTIISKYCGTFDALRRRLGRPATVPADSDADEDNPSERHETTWHIAPSHGLDEALINKITMYRYKRGEGLVDGMDCSVCLSEFRDDDSLRLLPKCSHAFHLHCIDTWLRSHSNCPLCRANIVTAASPPPPPPLPAPELAANAPTGESEDNVQQVVIIADIDMDGEDDAHLENECDDAYKDLSTHPEGAIDIIEIGDGGDGGFRSMRRSFSMNSSCSVRLSIADVLQISMEDEFLAAKDQGLLSEAGSSRWPGGELRKGSDWSRSLRSVMSPVPMKRSFSSGRFCFSRQGRGKNTVLPL